MLKRVCALLLLSSGTAATAQTSGISGLNTPGPGTGGFNETATSSWNRGADPKEWQQRRLARLKTILAAHPDATAKLQAISDPKERVTFIRQLDRRTSGYGGF